MADVFKVLGLMRGDIEAHDGIDGQSCVIIIYAGIDYNGIAKEVEE